MDIPLRSMSPALNIRGIRLNNLTLDDALNAIDAALCRNVTTRIAFVNADCVNLAARDSTYRNALDAFDWVFIDGIGMRIAGRILNQPVLANVNGTDLFPRLCADLSLSGRRLFLLGAKPGVANAAASWARAHFPGLIIAGAEHGFYAPEDIESLVGRVRNARPDVMLVAMGAPGQEKWILDHAATCGACVTLGVGGLFDYYSGNIPRAPLWMRRCGLEWLFRLYQEPRRLWKRYLLGNWVFMARIVSDLLSQLWRGKR